MTKEYTITATTETGIDIVTVSDPVAAVELIQNTRAEDCSVTYTGDPFADAAALAAIGEED